eukprot:1159985-Pelagomonas_calceolata.AAC.3
MKCLHEPPSPCAPFVRSRLPFSQRLSSPAPSLAPVMALSRPRGFQGRACSASRLPTPPALRLLHDGCAGAGAGTGGACAAPKVCCSRFACCAGAGAAAGA